jgi:hypothetical protein
MPCGCFRLVEKCRWTSLLEWIDYHWSVFLESLEWWSGLLSTPVSLGKRDLPFRLQYVLLFHCCCQSIQRSIGFFQSQNGPSLYSLVCFLSSTKNMFLIFLPMLTCISIWSLVRCVWMCEMWSPMTYTRRVSLSWREKFWENIGRIYDEHSTQTPFIREYVLTHIIYSLHL